LLTGQVLCPKTPPNAIASFAGVVPPPDEWVIDGVCAYVPQVSPECLTLATLFHYVRVKSAWLRNASIKGRTIVCLIFYYTNVHCFTENILFNLPYVEERYQRTLKVCALVNDLKILEDGDESEIGERGVCAYSLTLLCTEYDVKASHRLIYLADKKLAVSFVTT
jgi:hypothetical protein